MDSFKTGAFIKNLRIEKNLTQKELADALNCTDKAISRWETGKGFPDIVFLTPLAQELGVTVNELLAGEKISREELVSKSDEVIISTMKEAEKDKNKLQNIIFIILCVVQTLSIYISTIFNLPMGLFVAICIFLGFLNTKVKFAFPIIIAVTVIPLAVIREGWDSLYHLFLLLSIMLAVGLSLIGGTTLLKNIVIAIYKKWKKEHIVIKSLSAISLVLLIVLGIVGIVYYEKNIEKIDVIEIVDNDETLVRELTYNGHKYYSCDSNYIENNFEKVFANNNVFPDIFPLNMLPYDLDKTIDLSICMEYLPELENNQKYIIPEDTYFIYANDSITKPVIIYIYEDSSYNEWFISEDFDFKMPTTETHKVADIALYESYAINPVYITDEEKINEIIAVKSNREDLLKLLTYEEYGKWNYIYIRYEKSPFTERIGVVDSNGNFQYEEAWEEKYEEYPYGYYSSQ